MTEAEEQQLEHIALAIARDLDELARLVAAGVGAANHIVPTTGDGEGPARVNAGLAALTAECTALHGTTEAAVTSAKSAWQAAVERNEQALLQTITAANDQLVMVHQRLDDISTGIATARSSFADVDSTCAELLDEAGESIEEAFTQAFEIADAVSGAIEEQFEAFSDRISALTGQMDELLVAATAGVEEALEAPIENLREAINEAMEQFRELLTTEVKEAMIEAVATEFLTPAKEQIDTLVARTQEQIELLSEDIVGGSQRSAEKRQALKFAVETLEAAIQTVLSALNGLRGLAGTVGISI